MPPSFLEEYVSSTHIAPLISPFFPWVLLLSFFLKKIIKTGNAIFIVRIDYQLAIRLP
jgi:hypothetical protein